MIERSVTHATFTIERDLAATPTRVFAAFSDAASHERWYVQDAAWELTEYEHDFRVGGREQGRFRMKQGDPTYVNDTVYQDIVPGQRIVFAYTMKQDETLISASLATVELKSRNGGTHLVFTEQGAFLDGHDNAAQREQGWHDLVGRLEAETVQAATTDR